MTRCFRFVVLFLMVFLISACHHLSANTSYSVDPVANCHATCQKHLALCQSTCKDNCSQCSLGAYSEAHRSFVHYVHEQKLRGCEVSRELNSYLDPLQCRKVTCSCSDDYQRCNASC